MRVSVKIDRLKNNYNEVKSDIKRKMIQVVAYGINEVRNTAVNSITQGTKSGEIYQKYNPRRQHKASASGEAPAGDTGFLQNNIITRSSTDGLSGTVVSRGEYSAHLEFGTSKMGARPFMQPSLEQNRPKIRARLRKLMG